MDNKIYKMEVKVISVENGVKIARTTDEAFTEFSDELKAKGAIEVTLNSVEILSFEKAFGEK